MLKQTHITFGLASGIVTLDYIAITPNELPVYFTGLIIGSLINDIDTPKSTIGRKLPLISHLLKILFGHRNFFHSLLFYAFLFSITRAFLPFSLHMGIAIGSASHLIGDMMTSKGIKLLFPIVKKNIKFPLTFVTGGYFEKLLMFCFSAYILYRATQVTLGPMIDLHILYELVTSLFHFL